MNFFFAIKSSLEAIFDTILPLRERSRRTNSRSIQDIPLSLESHELLGARVTTIMNYRDEAVRDLIRSLKYDGSRYAAHLAALLLADYLSEEIASLHTFSAREILLTPVPLHPSRKRERGFNQIELVLRALPQEFKDGTRARFVPEILIRTRATLPQTHLPRHERLHNLRDAFALNEKREISNTHIFLIDDVTTTGTTLSCASSALLQSGARISLIALARA